MEPSGDVTEDVGDLVLGTDVEQSDVVESAVQVGPGNAQVKEEEANENVGIELGDLIEVHSSRADIETVRGRVYYIDDERISILEEGKSRKLVVIDFEQDEEGDYVPKEEYEITDIVIKEKRLLPSFVAQRGIARDLLVETFTAEGEKLVTYKVKEANEIQDRAIFVDEAGEELVLEFAYKGIPKDRSVAPFDVLRIVEEAKKEEVVPNEAAPGEVEEVFLDFEFLDELEAPEVRPIAGLFQGIERPAWEILYKDDEQINDMLRERIADLDPAAQRNAKRIRAVSRLVWNMLALRNDITRYSGSTPVGRKPVAFQTLVELLEKTQFPLAKQVLAVAKAIYLDHSFLDLKAYERGTLVDPLSSSNPQILLNYLQDIVIKGERYLDSQLKDGSIAVDEPGAALAQKIPRWVTIWQGYFNKYFNVIAPVREDGDLKDLRFDQDFFRMEIPKDSDKDETLVGFRKLFANQDKMVTLDEVSVIKFSLMRALGPRYGRYGEGGLTHKVEDADSAETKGFLVFPLEFIRDLGYIRSGILALDSALSLRQSMTMKEILRKAGNIVDIPEQDKIISVSFDGSTLGNTEIADWLKGQAIYGGGIGDLMPTLRSFGLLQAEFTVPQRRVLDAKIQMYIAGVRKMISQFRQEIKKEREDRKPIQTNGLLPQQRMFEMIKKLTSEQTGEPILKELIADFQLRHISYRSYDVAMFAYMYIYYPDLLLNALAQNPEVATERLRVERDLFVKQLTYKLEEEKKLQDRGDPPQVNPCQHLKDLNKIRKIQSNTERMLTLNTFIRKYKLKKEDHWLWCNSGEPPHHLICEHEYLLLQEFLRPKEKDTLHKEILLTFSGGKFNGQYICKQCGQPIMDYEYETNLERDDNGAPMSGRAVLVDEDALEEEKLQRAVIMEAEEEEKVETKSEDEQKIYSTLNELASLVGIYPDLRSYHSMISRVKNALALVPDREKYARSQKALKKAGKVSTDYDVFINRILVSLCAVSLIIDVQTHVPEYVIRYTLAGCAKPEFTGFPRDGPSGDKMDTTALEYIACAISSITHRTAPWDLTGYQSISSSTARTNEIMLFLKTFATQLAETPEVQQAIIDKKQYLLETFGYETSLGRPRDSIPYGFTPAPFIVTKELAAEAENPVVVETASEAEKVRAYIKQAHIYALKYGKYLPGTSSEASCCYNSVMTPAEFWKKVLFELPPREAPEGSKGSRLFVEMRPRPLEKLFANLDTNSMYRLFLRVCFRGPRIGLQHEPGYDNTCPWCEFHFPDDPREPPPTRRFAKEGKKQKKYDEEYEGDIQSKKARELDALREAGVSEITKDNFEDLLNQVNRNGIIPPQPVPVIPTSIENFRGMLSVLPAPFEDYEQTIRETLVNLQALPPDASRTDILNAFNDLSNKALTFENEIRSRLGDDVFLQYQELVKLPSQDLGEALRTYFLIPFQRMITIQYGLERKFRPIIKPSKTTDFSVDVMADLTKAYKLHTNYLYEIVKDLGRAVGLFARAKIQEAIDRLSVVSPLFIRILRPTIIRGGAIATQFLQRLIVGGIFAEFIMPNHVPQNVPGLSAPLSAVSLPAKLPAKILRACLLQYKQEGLNFNSEQIREIIQDRMEKEKAKIIKDKTDMTPEERKLDNLLQRYGMGHYAVGGTKAIWKYDPKHYVTEREEMLAAGITRFGEAAEVYRPEGDGYDVEQTSPDDA